MYAQQHLRRRGGAASLSPVPGRSVSAAEARDVEHTCLDVVDDQVLNPLEDELRRPRAIHNPTKTRSLRESGPKSSKFRACAPFSSGVANRIVRGCLSPQRDVSMAGCKVSAGEGSPTILAVLCFQLRFGPHSRMALSLPLTSRVWWSQGGRQKRRRPNYGIIFPLVCIRATYTRKLRKQGSTEKGIVCAVVVVQHTP